MTQVFSPQHLCLFVGPFAKRKRPGLGKESVVRLRSFSGEHGEVGRGMGSECAWGLLRQAQVGYLHTGVTSRVGTRCDYRGRDKSGRGSRQPSARCTRRNHASRKPPVGFRLAEGKTGNPYVALKVLCIRMGTPVTHQSAAWASLF